MFLLGLLYVVLGAVLVYYVRRPRARHRRRASWSRSGSSPTGSRSSRWAAAMVTPEEAPRAARHRRPALRAGRHAQAAGRDRRHRRAQRVRHRPQRRSTRSSARRPASCAGSTSASSRACSSHELSHVAHRDVTVMTIASFVGVLAGLPDPDGALQRHVRRPARRQRQRRRAGHACHHAGQRRRLRAVSFLLTRALSRYRELAADRAGALLTGQPSALASALTKISGEMGRIPTRDLRAGRAVQRVLLRPGDRARLQPLVAVLHPPAAGEAARPARPHLRRARPAARDAVDVGLARHAARPQQAGPSRTSTSCSRCRTPRSRCEAAHAAAADRASARSASAPPRAAPSPSVQGDVQQLLDADGGPTVEVEHRLLRLHLAARPARRRPTCPALVTDLHAVNATLQDNGFGPRCCARWWLRRRTAAGRLGLVYLYKRGHLLPVRPAGRAEQRDNALELQVRAALGADLPIEPDLARWFPVWGAPGL